MAAEQTGFAAARRHMVESQLLPNRVTDRRLLAAMAELPRERFAPPALRSVAYMDEDLPVAPGRYLMEPMVLARLLQNAAVAPSDLALTIGCATGYSAAVLARLAGTVVALECDRALAAGATDLLGQLGVDNAAVIEGDLARGLPQQGPYDVILLDGAVERLPEALTGQLAEGGRLVGVVRKDGVGTARLVRRTAGLLSERALFDAGTPPLPGFAVEPGFVF